MTTKIICRIYFLIIITGLSTACLQKRDSSSYPFGIELSSLAQDVESKTYKDLIKTMTKEDLDDEWKRVATPDNYLVFCEEHGGLENILADKKLKASYEERKNIANKFISIITDAYISKKKKPPFNQEKIEKLLSGEIRRSGTAGSFTDVTIDTIISSIGAQNQWPGFRGPAGQGIAIAKDYPLKWSKTQNILWKASLNGRGNSSPVIWDNRIFITSASVDGKIRGLFCFNRLNGGLLWEKTVPAPEKIEKINPKNSYATATPVTDGERVIAFFGNCGFFCYNMNGELIWKRNVGEFTTMHGPGTNPVLYRDKVIFVQDQGNNKSVFIALNKRTGEIIWSQERDKMPDGQVL
jgi:outer membrane protein assembly factor BamB